MLRSPAWLIRLVTRGRRGLCLIARLVIPHIFLTRLGLGITIL
ncbi:MAG: hypothetical protein V2A74_03240 [bacterium]